MGSGLLAAAVVITVVTWRVLVRRDTSFRASWPTLAFMAVIVVGGLLIYVEVPWHQEMKARTLRDFYVSIVHSLQWPHRGADWAAAILWLPWLLVMWRVVIAPTALRPRRRAVSPSPPDAPVNNDGAPAALLRAGEVIAALGGWAVIQAVAMAYARGAGAGYPASRYMDTLAFGTTANALALGWLLMTRPASRTARVTCYALGLAWVATLAVGLRTVAQVTFAFELPDAKKYYIKAEGHMRRYLATNNPHELAHPGIPFPSADGLVERLANPHLRKLMPLPIRAALPMTADSSATASGFEENNAVRANWENPPRRGLTPQTTPLDDTSTWGSHAAAETAGDARHTWRSQPITAQLGGWLKFETAGDVSSTGKVRLELHDAKSGAVLATVAPSRRAGDTWRAAYVRAPREPFIVVATDASPAEWLAFSPPVEMGTLSYWAWQATRHGRLLLYLAALASAVIALLAWTTRTERSHS
jgi:hypothetical protein